MLAVSRKQFRSFKIPATRTAAHMGAANGSSGAHCSHSQSGDTLFLQAHIQENPLFVSLTIAWIGPTVFAQGAVAQLLCLNMCVTVMNVSGAASLDSI